jgi:hypothetical protein
MKKFISKKEFLDNFFRKDLKLKDRWWHRFLLILFVALFIWVVWITISNMLEDNQLPKYARVEKLSDRMTNDVQLIGDLVKTNEKIAIYEHNLYGTNQGETISDGEGNSFYHGQSFYELRGGELLKQKYYCSSNISNQVERVSDIMGVYFYKGNQKVVTLSDFKSYLKQNNANCIMVWNMDSEEYFGTKEKKALAWGLAADDMVVWKVSIIKSIFSVAFQVSIIVIGFMILLVIYYKVILNIIFGSKKKD